MPEAIPDLSLGLPRNLNLYAFHPFIYSLHLQLKESNLKNRVIPFFKKEDLFAIHLSGTQTCGRW